MEGPLLYDHVAVNLQNYVIFFAGESRMDDISSWEVRHFIWSYNLYTDHWRKYTIPLSQSTPHMVTGTSAVAIGSDVFMFGGICPVLNSWNHLWRLTINKNRYFRWTKIPEKAKAKTPSERYGHSAWEYKGKMWVFGGRGIPPSQGFLNEHGDFIKSYNNQLVCYDPCSNTWTNPKCLGAVSSPRGKHATATIREKVFLYGGYQSNPLSDFFMMNMDSLSWTMMKTNQINPGPRCLMSLTAVTANNLVLYGWWRKSHLNKPWILDIEDEVWKPYTQSKDCIRYHHTGTRGLTTSVLIIGGLCHHMQCNPPFHLMLEPKSLQQLSMHIIYQHKDMLPWKSLPSKMINQLMDPAEDEPDS